MDWEVILRLLLAMFLGGMIGFEREIGNRPAGFRTHTLVCVGSTLVVLTSQFLVEAYQGVANVDPTRMGAQVISGIGFLGVGTIIHQGSKVSGLTTAASLWVVACLGLGIGAGFYWGAVAATIIVYITLILLKKIERHFIDQIGNMEIILALKNIPGQIAKVTTVMGRLNVQIIDIQMTPEGQEWISVKFSIKLPPMMTKKMLLNELSRVEGVLTDTEEG